MKSDLSKFLSVKEHPMPVGTEMFVAVALIPEKNNYVTDIYGIWQPVPDVFERWPHTEYPTHWYPIPGSESYTLIEDQITQKFYESIF